jgi:ribosomal-protein-alanine N-acetyltransferase
MEQNPAESSIPFEIRTAGWRDLMALRRLEQVCFDLDAWPLVDLLGVLTLPGIVRLKAQMGGDLVGFVAGDVRPREHLGWIATIGVLPRYRRMGIANQLLDLCETGMGQPKVRLCVRKSNVGAIRLYARRGYQHVAVWSHYYNGGEDALVLEKRLDAIP